MINSTTKHVYIFATHVTYSNYNAGALLSLSTIAARSTPSRRADFATMQLLRFLLEVFERLGVTVRFTSENVRSLRVAPAGVARTRIDTLKSSGKAVLRWSQKVGAAKAFSRSYVSLNSPTRRLLPKYIASSSEELVESVFLESQRAFKENEAPRWRFPEICETGTEVSEEAPALVKAIFSFRALVYDIKLQIRNDPEATSSSRLDFSAINSKF